MIIEGLVTTHAADGRVNIAPMGPRVDEGYWNHLLLRPFKTSTTYQNLATHGEGVFHVTDDVLMIAQAAIGEVDPPPILVPATVIMGHIIQSACRFYEFRITEFDDSSDRTEMRAEVIATGRNRDFFGFNRAKHAVLEAAILATRLHLIPRDEVLLEFEKQKVIIEKTGGPAENQAFEFLFEYSQKHTSIATRSHSTSEFKSDV